MKLVLAENSTHLISSGPWRNAAVGRLTNEELEDAKHGLELALAKAIELDAEALERDVKAVAVELDIKALAAELERRAVGL